MAYGFADTNGASALVGAVQWVEATLLGTLATTIAVIAVAATGMMMFTGRIDWRRGATVIVGCFIVFGAASIAEEFRAAAAGSEGNYVPIVSPAPSLTPLPMARGPSPPPPANDPYAGAAAPVRQQPEQ